VRPTATFTPTATTRPTPTSRVRPTPTTPSTPWAPGVFYGVGAHVTYNGPTYRCLQSHTSSVGHEPPNVPALWQQVANAGPYTTVNTSKTSVAIGDTVVVTAYTTAGMPSFSITVKDVATGQAQDPSNPIFTPAQPASQVPGGNTASWTLTAARAGTVVFVVVANGEINDPACGCWRFAPVTGQSFQVVSGGPVLSVSGGQYNCQAQLMNPQRLTWSPVTAAQYYDVQFSRTFSGSYQSIARSLTGTTYDVWDPSMNGYYKIKAVTSAAVVYSSAMGAFLGTPGACPPPTPTPCPIPPPIGAPTPGVPTGLSTYPTSQNVQLVWNPPTSGNTTDVHILRSTTPGGPYAFLVSVNGPVSSWADPSVTNGTRYYYVLQGAHHYRMGADASCSRVYQNLSAYSNEATAAPNP
jgi:hypothetical protein